MIQTNQMMTVSQIGMFMCVPCSSWLRQFTHTIGYQAAGMV
ncbi:hypothetical protein phiGM223_14 [Pseudomonas phage phiGM22-3]|uniref:Uncharacterized protein n=1 Tax=Pseudomonas phage phiGM22-3 TaxID=2816462 RepID=A0A8T8IWZ8_9CAUD|nr:hypothetical protein phiGM223_14 [Pseudomonas phage phiGM22-3]